MAAPENVNIKNLQGKYVMNKTLSDPFDPVLALQGIGWMKRKVIGVATVTLLLKQYPTKGEDGQPTTQVDIDSVATGGIPGTSEYRTFDWQYRGHTDHLFGTMQGRTRWNTLKALLDENKGQGHLEEDAKFLVEGAWLPETLEGEIVESFVDNDAAHWTGWQIWGFAEINGERRYTRRLVIRRKDKEQFLRIQLVYDWAGELV